MGNRKKMRSAERVSLIYRIVNGEICINEAGRIVGAGSLMDICQNYKVRDVHEVQNSGILTPFEKHGFYLAA